MPFRILLELVLRLSVCLRSDFGRLQKWTSIFGGENDVDQDQGEGLRNIMKTQSIYVPVTLYLAPLQGASPLVVRSQGFNLVSTLG